MAQKVYTSDLDRLTDKLLARRFNFILSIRIPDTPGIVWTPLYESNLDILVPESHPLAGKSALTLSDLCGERLLCNVTVAEGLDIVQNLATRTGRDPELLYDGYDMELIASAVGHGYGVGVVTSTALEEFRAVSGLAAAEQPVRVLPLRDEKLRRTVCIGHRSDMGFPSHVRAFFDGAFRFLKKGGVLAFDISSRDKLTRMDGAFYGEERDSVAYLWQNRMDPETRVLAMDLTFFVETEGGLYRRFEEHQLQRAHDVSELTAWLGESGFTDIRVYGDRTMSPPAEGEARIHFTAKKS